MDQQEKAKTISNIPPQRPSNLVFMDAKSHLVGAVNEVIQDYQVPFWLLEIMLNDIFNEVKAQAKVEYEQAKTSYKMELATWESEHAAKEAAPVEAE